MKNEWDLKFLRDGFLMPFGSMCNAYGLINEGKGISVQQFLEDMEMIEQEAQTIIDRAIEKVNKAQEMPQLDMEEPNFLRRQNEYPDATGIPKTKKKGQDPEAKREYMANNLFDAKRENEM